MKIKDEKDLGRALKKGEGTLEIEGNLKDRILRIKATGKVTWIIASGSILIAVTVIIASGGTATPASALIGAGAITILGFPAALSALIIAIAAGGVGALNKLRSYKVVSNSENKLILKRK